MIEGGEGLPIKISINVKTTLKGEISVEVKQQKREPGINANVLTVDGKIEGVEFSGYLGKGVTADDISKLARDFEASARSLIEKLAS